MRIVGQLGHQQDEPVVAVTLDQVHGAFAPSKRKEVRAR
jgi:hypothetical protein